MTNKKNNLALEQKLRKALQNLDRTSEEPVRSKHHKDSLSLSLTWGKRSLHLHVETCRDAKWMLSRKLTQIPQSLSHFSEWRTVMISRKATQWRTFDVRWPFDIFTTPGPHGASRWDVSNICGSPRLCSFVLSWSFIVAPFFWSVRMRVFLAGYVVGHLIPCNIFVD